VVLIATRGSSHKSSSTGASTTSSTSTSSTSPSTTSSTTSTEAPSTTTSSTTSTTSTTVLQGSNRAATADETAALQNDVGHSGYTISNARIAGSDPSWAAVTFSPLPGTVQQGFEEVDHRGGSGWSAVADGTSQVACNSEIPSSV